MDRERDRAPSHEASKVRSVHRHLLNEHWPLRDAKGNYHAVGIPDQQNPIPVRLRVVWDGGAKEWIDGLARRWTCNSVFVAFSDDRIRPRRVGQARGCRAAQSQKEDA